MYLESFRINGQTDLEGSEKAFQTFVCLSLWNFVTIDIMHKYIFCENFKIIWQVEGKITCSFKHLNKHSTNYKEVGQVIGDPPDQPNRWTVTTGGKPPHQPNGQMTMTDGKPPHQPNRRTTMMVGDQLVNRCVMVMTHVIVTVYKFKWAPWLPSLSPLFKWEPRGHVAISNVATNFRFPFANDIAHPWSVPHISVASLCLQGGNEFFYLIHIVRFLSR